MINIDPTILIIMGEVIVALIVAMVGVLFFMLKSRKRDRAAVAELQGRLKSNASKRQEWFEDVLATNIEGGDAEANRELATVWVEKEDQFYAQLVNMYVKRNSTALRGLDKLLHEYTASYLELVSLMRTRIDEEHEAVPEAVKDKLERLVQEGERLTGIIKTLEADNARLNTELEAANKEIDQAMHEYSLAFHPGGMTGSAATAPAAQTAVAAEPATVEQEEVAALEPEMPVEPEAELEPPAEEMMAEVVDLEPEETEVALAEPIFEESEVTTEEPVAEEVTVEIEEPISEPVFEAADESATLVEMDLAALDQLEEVTEEVGATEATAEGAAEEWLGSFDEKPDSEEIQEQAKASELTEAVESAEPSEAEDAAKGAVIDLAEEGEIILPELNELMAAAEDEDVGGDLLPGDELPVLDESVDGGGDIVDEDNLLAQLEGLEEIDLPSFSKEGEMDESADLAPPSTKEKGEEKKA